MRCHVGRGLTLSGIVLGILFLWGCTQSTRAAEETHPAVESDQAPKVGDTGSANVADVISVQVTDTAGAYRLSVEISSPDRGCDQYADWWEVLSEDGELIYRRILAHSHVNEQPFVRSGGPIAIDPETVVWVRAHMHPDGYGGAAFKGSVQSGFQEAKLDLGFAIDVLHEPPLPDGCAF